MTNNQIAYQSHLESQRHNIVNETIAWSNLAETHRHNLVYEAQGWASIEETHRHNVVVEGETERHNRQTEAIGWGQLSETVRHNKQQEAIGWGNITLGYAQLAESKRKTDISYYQWANEFDFSKQKHSDEYSFKYWNAEYDATVKQLMQNQEMTYKYEALKEKTVADYWANLNGSFNALTGGFRNVASGLATNAASYMQQTDWVAAWYDRLNF